MLSKLEGCKFENYTRTETYLILISFQRFNISHLRRKEFTAPFGMNSGGHYASMFKGTSDNIKKTGKRLSWFSATSSFYVLLLLSKNFL